VSRIGVIRKRVKGLENRLLKKQVIEETGGPLRAEGIFEFLILFHFINKKIQLKKNINVIYRPLTPPVLSFL